MRKSLSILIFTICLGFSSVPARANVTNQLDEILVQLDNLEQVIQFFVDNEAYLEYWLQGEVLTDFLEPMQYSLNHIANNIVLARQSLQNNIVPDLSSIQADVSALSANVAVYVSQIVNSINGVTSEIDDLHQWLIFIGLDRIQYMLTQAQLDNSLDGFLLQLMYEFQNSSSIFSQILQSIQSLDTTSALQQSLNSIADALTQFGNVSIYLDLVEELEALDLNLNLDISSSLSGLEYHLSNTLYTLQNFSSAFNHFLQNFQTFQADQLEMQADLTQFIDWYQGYFFEGLETWGTRHSEWMARQEEREALEQEQRDKEDSFHADDAEFPSDSDVDYITQTVLEEVKMEEPEIPDDKIYVAFDKAESDLDEVESELTGAMDVVDAAVSDFLQGVKFHWGEFNPVLSFSFSPPVLGSDYTMALSYDFSKSDLKAPCRAASTGVWAIILFMESFFAISYTLHAVIKN